MDNVADGMDEAYALEWFLEYALKPGQILALVRAFDEIRRDTRYGEVRLILADGYITNIKVTKSIKV